MHPSPNSNQRPACCRPPAAATTLPDEQATPPARGAAVHAHSPSHGGGGTPGRVWVDGQRRVTEPPMGRATPRRHGRRLYLLPADGDTHIDRRIPLCSTTSDSAAEERSLRVRLDLFADRHGPVGPSGRDLCL